MNDASAQSWNAGYGATAGSILGEAAPTNMPETITDRLNGLISRSLNISIHSGELADRIAGRGNREVGDGEQSDVKEIAPSLTSLIGTLEGILAQVDRNVARATRAL